MTDAVPGHGVTMQLSRLLLPERYIHRRAVVDSGWRPDAIRTAVNAEKLLVYRRQWIVHPSADRAIHVAAAAGGHVTCVSAAAMMGIYRPGHDSRLHVALHPHSSSRCQAVVHRATVPAPRHPQRLVDGIENVLSTVATCIPFDQALAVWESALRTKAIDQAHLQRVQWRGTRADELARAAGILSDSGLETLFVHRLRLASVSVRQQVSILGHAVDGLVGSRLVLQIDGFAHHSDARQRRADIGHDRALRLAGYTVMRFDYHQIMNEWPWVQRQIVAAVAQGLHLA